MLSIAGLALIGAIAATSDTFTVEPWYPPGQLQFFHTSDRDVESGTGDLEGSLAITFGADGTISGNYRPVDDARMIDVHGSLKSDRISLFIGIDGPPIVGVLQHGRIIAYALENDREHSFVAVPEPDRR